MHRVSVVRYEQTRLDKAGANVMNACFPQKTENVKYQNTNKSNILTCIKN